MVKKYCTVERREREREAKGRYQASSMHKRDRHRKIRSDILIWILRVRAVRRYDLTERERERESGNEGEDIRSVRKEAPHKQTST